MYFSLRKCNNFPIVSDRKSAALLQFYQPGTNTSLCTTRLQWSSYYYFSNFVKIISFLTLPDSFISTLFRAPLWWTGVLCPKFSLTEDFLAELLPIRLSKKIKIVSGSFFFWSFLIKFFLSTLTWELGRCWQITELSLWSCQNAFKNFPSPVKRTELYKGLGWD